MSGMTNQGQGPQQCQECRWRPAEAGHTICSKCAIRILKETCDHPWGSELVIVRAANGYEHPRRRCRRCYSTLKGEKARDVNVAEADVIIVNEASGKCARCERTDAIEVHHWAPRHLFRDADDWPTSLLCPDCHRLWHQVTRTGSSSSDRAAVQAEKDEEFARRWDAASDWCGGLF